MESIAEVVEEAKESGDNVVQAAAATIKYRRKKVEKKVEGPEKIEEEKE